MSTTESTTSAPPDKSGLFANIRRDIPAGMVVFLVALPLCLGIAQASGAPLLAGLISGIVGGLIVGAFSGSQLSVSGPAAGLAVIVATGATELGFTGLLLATVLAGLFQIILGALRLGTIAHFFPNAVIKGMLASIGVLIILKQLPHAVGFDSNYEGDQAFFESDGHNTFTALVDALGALSLPVTLISLACVAAYLLWPMLQRGVLQYVPPALVVVVLGATLATALGWLMPDAGLSADHLVSLPIFDKVGDAVGAIRLPEFGRIGEAKVWATAITIAIVASLETLLSLEAVDRLDTHRRISPPNRELMAQGVGNIVAGLLGGLPVTSVIVRSSANVAAGGQTRMSAMVHGLLLLVGVLFFAAALNHIPLAALAVVLIFVGLKLTPASLWVAMWRAGLTQFIPFAVTIGAVIFTDLLKGTLIGLGVGVVFAIRQQQQGAIVVVSDAGRTLIQLSKDLTFLNKPQLKEILAAIPAHQHVIINRTAVDFLDDDIEEILLDFDECCNERDITVQSQRSLRDVERRAALEATHAAIDGIPAKTAHKDAA